MADAFIPPDIVPDDEQIEIVDDTTSVMIPLFGGGLMQRTTMASPRVRVRQKWSNLRHDHLSRLMAMLARCEGPAATLYCAVGFGNQGAMPTSEYNGHPYFDADYTGPGGANSWSINDFGIMLDHQYAVFANSKGAQACTAYAISSADPPTSSALVGRSFIYPGHLTSAATMGSMMQIAGGTNGNNGYRSGGGYSVATEISSSATYQLAVRFNQSAATPQHLGATIMWGSLAPCMQVASVALSGATNIAVRCAPQSTTGVLYSGDWFEVNRELKRVTGPVMSDSGGYAFIEFQPPLFRSVAIGDAVITKQPMGRMVLTEPPKLTNHFGRYADLELTMEHVYE